MNLDKLREELSADEGCEYKIYKDHLGYPTFGIGHLITEDDPESGKRVGTKVTEERVVEAFESDIRMVLDDCHNLYDNFSGIPEECQLILANMMFNMGRTRLGKFKNMNAAVEEGDYSRAANEMVNSRWYTQVRNRASRLVERMRSLA